MIVASICCRGGSKGVPGKALRLLGGRPLITWTVECAQTVSELDRIVVSTDDPKIAETAAKSGAEVPFLRPAELARDDSSKWNVFRHLVQTLEEDSGDRVDVLVDLDIGVPLRRPSDITRCIHVLLRSSVDIVATVYKANRNPYFNMVERASNGLVQIVKAGSSPIHNRQQAPIVWALSPAVYAIRRDCLWRLEHWSLGRLDVVELPRERTWDIDEEIDLAFIEFLIERHSMDR